jgi:hypothetical protein
MPTPIPIIIEAVQFTPDRAHVLVQYTARDLTDGPLSHTNLYHTTQGELTARSGAANWGDAEVKASLAAHLDAHGISADVVPNVVAAPPTEGDSPAAPPSP